MISDHSKTTGGYRVMTGGISPSMDKECLSSFEAIVMQRDDGYILGRSTKHF